MFRRISYAVAAGAAVSLGAVAVFTILVQIAVGLAGAEFTQEGRAFTAFFAVLFALIGGALAAVLAAGVSDA